MADPGADVVGVILAAGKGTRIYPFSATQPKPVLPVGNRPLLQRQVEMMRDHGITDIVIVIGYLGYAIVNALGDGSGLGVRIRYVEQRDTLGLAHAVGNLEPFIQSPFVLMLGDIYLETEGLGSMIEAVTSGEATGVLASRVEPDPEKIKRNFAIICDDGGTQVRRVIEKPRHTISDLKGSGLYTFDLPVFDAVRRTPRTAMRDEYEITDTVQIMIEDGYTILHSPLVSEDINLTVPSDLLEINLLDLERRGVDHLIGDGACIAPGAAVENSVIGAGVVISEPITIRDSLVFADTKLESGTDLRRVIVHGEGQIQC